VKGMFKTNTDRLDYSTMLLPPVGYKTSFAVGTTYSLDLETLISMCITLGLKEDIDSKLSGSPICMLEALRQVSDKMLIFCEAGQIMAPDKQNKLFPFLENSVVTVNVNKNKSFHPKVWLTKYENENEADHYRLLVLSRNLTFDHSWDVAVCLDGRKTERVQAKSRPLCDFLSYLLTRIDSSFDKMRLKKKSLKKLCAELSQVEFNLNHKNFYDFQFIPLGIDERYNKEATGLFNSTYHGLFVISPFLSKGIMERLRTLQLTNAEKVLVTRKSELPKLSKDFLEDYATYTLKDEVIDGEDRLEEEGKSRKQDIHAKIYLKCKYSDSELYLGSANASEKAFHGNIEFLLKLYTKNRYLNVASLKNDLFGSDEKLNPFTRVNPQEYVVEDSDAVQEELQKAIKTFCRAKVAAEISEGYTLTLKVDKLKTDLLKDLTLYINPIMITKKELVRETIVFQNLQLSQLSEFYVLTAVKREQELSRVVKIPTNGITDERDSNIFNSIVASKEGFIQYISFLLGEDYLLTFIEDFASKDSAYKFLSFSGLDTPVLYEKMLKTAATNPDKLREIKKVMEMISDRDIIPQEFYELYQSFEKAVL
jgi:hypothetical protein